MVLMNRLPGRLAGGNAAMAVCTEGLMRAVGMTLPGKGVRTPLSRVLAGL